jgi:hypothetical protein
VTCQNCRQDVKGTTTLIGQDDAEHFANFELGMEDYIPDTVDLCYECSSLVFSCDWAGLAKRQAEGLPSS